jgi:hypothetical protein
MDRRQLVVDGRPVAPLEVARTPRSRGRGLLGRDGVDGALLLRPARSVHTFAMRFALDVALCRADLTVVAVRTVAPGRLVLPQRAVRAVVEAEAGSFARWGLAAGSQLAVVDLDA